MQIVKTITELQLIQKFLKISGEKLVFIPTMGALHDGHISLINEAKNKIKKLEISGKSGKILVSIFVNPAQFENFGDSEDFKKYPNTLQQDIKKLENSRVDYLFCPEISEIYPEKKQGDHKGTSLQEEKIQLPEVFSALEGETRKGHFEGVFQVVKRLFEIVQPDYAVFGQKDFQQVMLIQYLQKKYFPNIAIITAPLFREKSGLAYSSRNMRFSEEEKLRAVILYKALTEMKKKFLAINNHPYKNTEFSTDTLADIGREILESEKLVQKIHYISMRDKKTFIEIGEKTSQKKYPQKGDIILISVEFSGIHLIDNMIL